MIIKQISIQGFKSYKDQVITEDFSPKHNVIVGRNGSGKSNFFAAVRFVLSDAYNSMGREERQALLYEGAGSAAMSAFVEIVFDNSDHRFPTGKDETIIRRTVGLKKDEFSLDRKSCTKVDISNLLESAGFSRSNPYYIVPQGRITSLAHAKDDERLELLKEVAGTRVYDSKKEESIKIVNDTNIKIEKIEESLEALNERLEELEKEQEDLRKFQELDKERRCLEYAIYSAEQNEITNQLEETMDDYQQSLAQTTGLEQELENVDNESQVLGAERDEKQKKYDAAMAERQYIVQDLESSVTQRIRLETIKSEKEKAYGGNQDIEEARKKLKKAQDQMKKTQSKLEEVEIQHKEAVTLEESKALQLKIVETKLQELYLKAGRSTQFKTTQERNSWIDEKIVSLSKKKEELEKKYASETTELNKLKRNLNGEDQNDNDFLQETEKTRKMLVKNREDSDKLFKNRNDLSDERKDLWRLEARLEAETKDLKSKYQEAERRLMLTMDRNTSSALQALPQIVKKLGISEDVYGPLYELFELDEDYRVAAESVSGASIFHVVVKDDYTASSIVDELKNQKSGRITFMPLSRLGMNVTKFPEADDAEPIINAMSFDEKYRPAIQQVFGKAIICPTLEIAAGYARNNGLTAVTFEGDRTDYTGVFSGGLSESRKSRLEIAFRLRKASQDNDEANNQLENSRSRIRELTNEINLINNNLQTLSYQEAELDDKLKELKSKAFQSKHSMIQMQSQADSYEKSLVEIMNEANSIQNEIQSLEKEKNMDLENELLPQEQEEMEQLPLQVITLQQELESVSKTRAEKESGKNQLQNLINELLEPRIQQLLANIEEFSKVSGFRSAEGYKINVDSELERLILAEEKARERLANLDENAFNHLDSVNKSLGLFESLKSKRDGVQRQLNTLLKSSESLLSRRQLLSQRLDECAANIRMLGVLPDEAFVKYVNAEHSELLQSLKTTNNKLRDYGHVNKKAVDQYNSFSRQRDDLFVRRDELNSSYDSIIKLISTLDQRKDEAIERTFKLVSKSFSEVFEKLVPAGQGRLIMQKGLSDDGNATVNQSQRRRQKRGGKQRSKTNTDDNDENGDGNDSSSINKYVGVSIKVSFNSKADEGIRIQQLSGGQKSLVSLALIFAIQRCDPAPFYLFDEIDANLDAVYRTAVANLIHSQSENCQFITTTFRPEMLNEADKFYGVTFSNKVSQISTITKESALTFVEQELVLKSPPPVR
ncbi:hypothetical protein BB559_005949 [Furculomyces boomerangus]|uniref:Structural maintenance of chromosomes protein n=2 Tax=Harpellales TaxID=61421 RepID=A0A2T9Y5S5_9FUNG|nr:hypothetical protein BB559_005949 [Furculomyces boomerangus]PVZ96529.1 hypothetical protein BB558_007553 [Smittium angustum]PWA03281.1 hypothetical protein BB558_000605 [Smittium angustum]